MYIYVYPNVTYPFKMHTHFLICTYSHPRLAMIILRRHFSLSLSLFVCWLQKHGGYVSYNSSGYFFHFCFSSFFIRFFFYLFLVFFFFFTLHTGGSSSYEQRGVLRMHTDITVSKARVQSISLPYDDFN